ncbi:MAG: adenylosuccinate lyase [Nitrososphaerota archaeon]|nr:adenylosuccinate lyase [Candidatus Bathyarchaeota archaeon]MDW8048097.1 adenylosuccinate lyase [Nitrososphaerota archaeon]
MPVLPIDTGRYGTPEMISVFEEENYVQKLLDVEAALAWAHGQVGTIPREDVEKIVEMASTKFVKLERIKEIEKEIKHDIMSVVRAFAEVCGPSGAYIHLGATSYDIVDTARALQLRDAINIIGKKLDDLELVLVKAADRYKRTVMMGRTHGQHALPITFGLKLAVWMREVSRHIQRLMECKRRVLVGKMTGAVGTQAGFGPHAMEIQRLVMERLGLSSVEVSTQIVQRDRHAELILLLANIASTLDKFATEIRELQRTEIAEVFEPFEEERQVGSSAMPHKRNPELCERICGLAKVMRGLVIPALENVVTWHERDLTQSSAERFIIPEACIITDYMLHLMIKIISGLRVDEDRMRRNIDITEGRTMSESVLMALVRKGMDRQKAHELVRRLTFKSIAEKTSLEQVLLQDEEVRSRLSPEEIEEALDPMNYLGTSVMQVEKAIEKTLAERRERGLEA